ncbi:HGH1 protein, partial [Copsychus sechellarum]|nr:HGH1 protein [Copsychus sechellarum]
LLRALSSARPPAELGALLCNLSQAAEGRRALLERSGRCVRALLALLRAPLPAQLRRGALGALRNCCFEHEHHAWLLGPEVQALPALLLPLAGNEELTEAETEQLPVDLQFLPPEHRREEEPEIRKMLLETLLLVLIGDEPEAGMENLLEVTIPEELEQQLAQLDRDQEGQGEGEE